MVEVIESGRPVLITPEGGRSHTPGMRQANSGVAYLADITMAPSLPDGIIGAIDDYLIQAIKLRRPCLLCE